jgi:hypothetical protein
VAPCLVTAIPYQWDGKTGESAFSLDVPEAWRISESPKRNGVIVKFRKGKVQIEVRSFAAREKSSIQQIVNQKAARLSSQYSQVCLIDERDFKFREDLHLSVWEIRFNGKTYREETAIAQAGEGPVVVSCFIPVEEYEKYRTHCENAFYSLSLESVMAKMKLESATKSDLMVELTRLYYLHVPGNLPVIQPDTVLSPAAVAPKPENKINYDENFILPDEKNK